MLMIACESVTGFERRAPYSEFGGHWEGRALARHKGG